VSKGFRYPERVINDWMDRIEVSLDVLQKNISDIDVVSDLETVQGQVADILNPPPEYGYAQPSVSLSGGGTYENGVSISDPSVSWNASSDARHAIVAQTLTGVGAIDPVELTGSHTYTGDTITTNTTKTMSVTDALVGGYGGTVKNASASWTFMDKRIYGVHAAPAITSAQLLTLSKEFGSGYTQTRYFDPTSQYIYFAWPLSWGGDKFIFTVNNLPNTAWEISTVSHTNDQGYTSDYRVFRSTYLQSGSNIKVEVA